MPSFVPERVQDQLHRRQPSLRTPEEVIRLRDYKIIRIFPVNMAGFFQGGNKLRKPTQEEIIKFCHANTVIDFLEVEVVPTPDGEARLELCADSRHANLYSMAHGGVLTTMADTAMGAKCLALGKKVVTISLTMEFMHATMTGTKIMTNAKVLHDGRQTMVCECEIIDAQGKLHAKASATFFVTGLFD